MDRQLGRDLAQPHEETVQPGVGIPVDAAVVVSLRVPLEVGKLGRGAATARSVLAGQSLGAGAAGHQGEASQAGQRALVEQELTGAGSSASMLAVVRFANGRQPRERTTRAGLRQPPAACSTAHSPPFEK